VSGQLHAAAALFPGIEPQSPLDTLRTGLDDVEKRKILPLPGLKLRLIGRPACSQSVYRLRYPGRIYPFRWCTPMFLICNLVLGFVVTTCLRRMSIRHYHKHTHRSFGSSCNLFLIVFHALRSPLPVFPVLVLLQPFLSTSSFWGYFSVFFRFVMS
jgi:hypothetical protein